MRKQTNKHAESESEVFSKSDFADFREVRGLGLGLGRPKSSATSGGKVTLQPQLFLNIRGHGAWNKRWRSFSKA
jgi:hypothetical protein